MSGVSGGTPGEEWALFSQRPRLMIPYLPLSGLWPGPVTQLLRASVSSSAEWGSGISLVGRDPRQAGCLAHRGCSGQAVTTGKQACGPTSLQGPGGYLHGQTCTCTPSPTPQVCHHLSLDLTSCVPFLTGCCLPPATPSHCTCTQAPAGRHTHACTHGALAPSCVSTSAFTPSTPGAFLDEVPLRGLCLPAPVSSCVIKVTIRFGAEGRDGQSEAKSHSIYQC